MSRPRKIVSKIIHQLFTESLTAVNDSVMQFFKFNGQNGMAISGNLFT
jgi:hypothetical protein